ncbi:46 kDa FK506-binding nuclear protein-like isoform X2 [Daphnia carinata]|uniref:46 kDa FK506-binding nuclear protein-like isoform X2 n=1 Tax=Daphnia carinata TaxID=120202 RepID=UPI00257E679C|nr:46 kDa FK506-binding nuclear protein-like isoform X2 [Daphnia carinata]
MFWGLIIEPGKKYSQTVDNSFHISKATLDLSSATDEDITLLLDYEGQQEYILCHLNKTNKQESLDLNFQAGDSISLFSHGQASVHLSGYLLGDDDEDDMTLGEMMEEEEEEEDEDEEMEEKDLRATLQAKAVKRPQPEKTNGKSQKKAKVEVEEEEDEEEAEEEEESKQPPAKQLSKKQKKMQKKAQQQQQQSPKPAAPQPEKKKEDKQPKVEAPKSPAKKTLPGGLIIEDVKTGNGPESKKGDKVAVYYCGKLAKNGKQFDQSNKGPGFKFELGKGQVIKGWDLGVAGMKVGGKRKLTIPASLAYGAGGAPPQIPPNSTLVFDVELKALN